MAELLVADSFRVRTIDGVAEARCFGAHLDRFARSVGEMLDTVDAPEDWWELEFAPFLKIAPALVSDGGSGFPRLELGFSSDTDTDASPLWLRVRSRPLPSLAKTIEFVSLAAPQLISPRVKGPNLEALSGLMRERGGEVLLTDRSGHVVEGSTTSVVWWDGDTICAAASQERVSSIMESIVLGIAEHDGYRVEYRDIDVSTLSCHPAWALNALHGIRRITRVEGTKLPSTPGSRLTDFRDALEETWQEVESLTPTLDE